MGVKRDKEGKWLDVSGFREAGDFFIAHNERYCLDAWGSPSWYTFWQEERRRCREGYEVGGHRITGDYYFYLNYCPIEKVDIAKARGRKARKVYGFPDFWDGDYEYFWCREVARNGILEALKVSDSEQDRIGALDKEERLPILMSYWDTLGINFKPLPDQLEGGKDIIIGKSRRKGFEQPNSEIVMTPTGYATMGSLKVGDEVLTPKGKSKIKEVYPQGKKDVYEVELFDGRKVFCGEDHLWKVYSHSHRVGYRQEFVMTTKNLIEKGLFNKKKKAYKYFLPIADAVEYEEAKVPIPAYTLGCILGDGNVSKQFKISGIDKEIIENCLSEIEYLFPNGRYKVGSTYKANTQFVFDCSLEVKREYEIKYGGIKAGRIKINPIHEELKLLGLACTSDKKYIPDIYKLSSKKQRLDLVQGLMDTDGSIAKDGTINFCNVSKKLVTDLQEVLFSLGIQSTLRQRKDKLWILYIGTNEKIFRLARKKKRINPLKKHREFSAIISIKKLGYQEESSCILIEDKEHLYLTRNYVVTHNSFKNASIAVCNFFHRPKSYTMLIAYEKKYLFPGKKTIFGKCKEYINFINRHTAWKMPSEYINTQSHIKASHKESRDGVDIEVGFLSEIEAISFKDNPDAGRGADAYDIIGEEVGAWGTVGGLKNTLAAMRSSSEAGAYKTGMITLFGTSGSLDSGTVDFADLFNRPQANNFIAFYDRWGKFSEKVEGFFFAKQLNMEGFYDLQGNSDMQGAIQAEEKKREALINNGATSREIQKRMQEEPLNSEEAFGVISTNTFPVVELQQQRTKVIALGLQAVKGTPVQLHYTDGKVVATPILDNSVTPITSYKDIPIDIQGCPIIYEHPIPDAPMGLYKIGYDPIRQDKGTSLASIIVYKGTSKNSLSHSVIVAEYVGRYEDPDDIDRVAEMFADLYHTQIMHENEVTGVKNYFRRIKRLNLLAMQPDAVISKNIKKSRVARVYGCHMNEQLKDAGERYVKSWLLTVLDFDENGDPIRVIDRIYSLRLLEELIAYHRKGNFDLVSALFMCMFQVQEEQLGKVYEEEEGSDKYEKFTKLMTFRF